jgi:hypothetical protein
MEIPSPIPRAPLFLGGSRLTTLMVMVHGEFRAPIEFFRNIIIRPRSAKARKPASQQTNKQAIIF